MFEHDSRAVVQGVGERSVGFDPFKAKIRQRQGLKEWAGDAHGEDGGTEVVVEAGEGDLAGGGCAADGFAALEDGDLDAGAGESDGGAEAVGSAADNGCFGRIRSLKLA